MTTRNLTSVLAAAGAAAALLAAGAPAAIGSTGGARPESVREDALASRVVTQAGTRAFRSAGSSSAPFGGVTTQRKDTPATALPLPHNSARYESNAGLGSAGEPFGTPGTSACPRPAVDGKFYGAGPSFWYRFTGNGSEVFLHTLDNVLDVDLDVFLAVYRADNVTERGVIACDVSLVEDRFDAAVVFDSQVGVEYLVQVAGADPSANNVGVIPVRAITSDLSTFAMPVETGSNGVLTNLGAVDEEVGERLVCDGTTYSETLWLKFTVRAPGTVTFTASATSLAPTATIFRRSDLSTPVGRCAVPTNGLTAQVAAEVTPGEYLVQVGDLNGDGGNFNYDLQFAEDVDLDNDGIARAPVGSDCNDANAGIRPGVLDVTNGIDDDCDGTVDPDVDGDGFPRPQDCNDAAAAIKPGAREVRGNRVDENCDGLPEPLARISTRLQAGFSPGRTTRVTRLRLLDVPADARITMRCRGGGCPRGLTQRLTKARRVHSLTRRFRRARLRPGAVLEVTVTARNLQGRRFRYQIRRNRAPRTASPFVGSGFSPS